MNMTRMRMVLIAVLIASTGIVAGWFMRGQETVVVRKHEEQSKKLDEISQFEKRTEDTGFVFKVFGPTKVTKRKTIYAPPARDNFPPFPGSPPISPCPAPEIASVEEEITETGTNTELVSTKSTDTNSLFSRKRDKLKVSVDTVADERRFAVSVLLGVNDKLEKQGQLNVSYRIAGPITVNGSANKNLETSGWSVLAGGGIVF